MRFIRLRRKVRPSFSALGPADVPKPMANTARNPRWKKVVYGTTFGLLSTGIGWVSGTFGILDFLDPKDGPSEAKPAPTVTVTVTATPGMTATPSPTSSLNASNWNKAPSYDLAQLRVPFLFAKTDPLTNHQYDLDAIKKQSETSPAEDTDLSYRNYGKSAHLEPWQSGSAAMGRFPGGSPTAESCLDAVERAGVEEWKPSEGAVGDGLCFVTGKSNVAYVKITSVQQLETQDVENKGPEIKAEITLWKRND